MIAAVAEKSRWPRIWDGALECGGRYTKSVQALIRVYEANESPWKREEAMPLL